MTKYSFIVLSSELDDFLAQLQDLGMMDITRAKREIDTTSKEMLDTSRRYKAVLGKLKNILKDFPDVTPIPTDIADENLLSTIEETYALRLELISKRNQCERDLQDSAVWGEFRNEDIGRLKSIGYEPHFFSVIEKKFKEQWKEDYPLHILSNSNGRTYFTILSPIGEELKFELQESRFPDCPASVLQSRIKDLEKGIDTVTGQIAGFEELSPRVAAQLDKLLTELDLYFANAASVKEGEGSISLLEGFAPTCDTDKIKEYLDNSDSFYLCEEAMPEDDPPVKLRNNWFSRLFEPIGSLYVLPKYDEVDLTPYFAPFYMLFFGLCLGDMGYGLVLVLVGSITALMLPKFSGYGKLIIWLGFGSIIMPLLSGTIFGMKLADIIPMPENIQALFFSDMKMFWFAILFGIFQILFAKMLHAIDCLSRKKWDAGLTNLGWCLVIVWCVSAYASMETGITFIPTIPGYVIGGLGLLLVLFCSKPSKNFFLRPLKGLVSLYDITGIFGDVLSYIRLFGLGTTGGILALVINSISMQLSGIPYIGWVFTVIMLIIGHIAVMGLSILGAFVHPVRLTFVEFYKNADFQGGGRAYNPLKINK